jgi:hypothetical protein
MRGILDGGKVKIRLFRKFQNNYFKSFGLILNKHTFVHLFNSERSMNLFQEFDNTAGDSREKPWAVSLIGSECCALKKCCKAYKKKGKYCKKCPKND